MYNKYKNIAFIIFNFVYVILCTTRRWYFRTIETQFDSQLPSNYRRIHENVKYRRAESSFTVESRIEKKPILERRPDFIVLSLSFLSFYQSLVSSFFHDSLKRLPRTANSHARETWKPLENSSVDLFPSFEMTDWNQTFLREILAENSARWRYRMKIDDAKLLAEDFPCRARAILVTLIDLYLLWKEQTREKYFTSSRRLCMRVTDTVINY